MSESTTPIAIVGVGAILPDAPDVATFWHNLEQGRYSISDVQPDRWDPNLYFDPDPKAPERTYSKIGGWVREWEWAPLAWHLPIPPKVGDVMDDAQKWAVACTHAALTDYGWPDRTIDTERTAVILGNAMAGEKHYQTALRIAFPEVARELAAGSSFSGLPADVRAAITAELRDRFNDFTPAITEDTMPGELGNCIAGRVANLFDLHGPNYIVDAACASAMAAFDASIAGLAAGKYDVAISGGIDRNMGAATYVKFCKIGALSATGTRPFDVGADGFVMGEGAALFVLKRLADAERDGDRIYAVVRGIGAASDGRGKGITAPNPVGQRMAVERAWRNAGLSPEVCSLVEAHGTSTRVGDVVEISSIADVFASADIAPGSIALGSVKSNIGHLKASAGAAGLLKATLALHAKSIPPSLGFKEPNPNIDWATSPFHVNTELTEWKVPDGHVRCAGVSAFGFGGTNFHAVLEEYVPGRLRGDGPRLVAVGADLSATVATSTAAVKPPLRGALVLGAATEAELGEQLRAVQAEAAAGRAPAPEAPTAAALAAPERIAIDYADAAELADKAAKALDALERGGAAWKLLQGRGIFRGHGPAGKVAFLYTGQGSQYANMLRTLREHEPAVAATFAEADEVMTPLLGRPLSDVIFVDPASPERIAEAEAELQRTEITQPAVLAVDIALTRLLSEYGVTPDMVMGHSLGEYGALVAAGSLSFPAALEAVSARGHEMAHLSIDDAGLMVAVMGPLETAEEIVASIDGNVVLANVNSTNQSVIGGATEAVLAAERACAERGLTTARLPVSHAFHTSIVAPASEPLRRTLERLELRSPVLPIIANVTGDFYPSGPDVVPEMLDLLARQVAAPVQFVDGLRRLADAGARVFVEVGPKWALRGFVADVLGNGPEGDDIVNLATNHPKAGDIVTFNHALCGLYAAGLGNGRIDAPVAAPATVIETPAAPVIETPAAPVIQAPAAPTVQAPSAIDAPTTDRVFLELGHLFADFLDRGRTVYAGASERTAADRPGHLEEPVVITGAALGTPGTPRIFDDANLGLLLGGEQFIDAIPMHIRNQMLEHRITRLVKSDHGASFERIDSPNDVLKLAARGGALDFGAEFGVDADRVAAYGRATQLAIGAGFDALRDAGIPLVMRYKTTHLGTQLPERWGLPDDLRDDTGVIFASAFPGIEEFAAESRAFAADQSRREERAELEAIRIRLADVDGADVALAEIDRRLHDLGKLIDDDPYGFDRRFLLRVLSMGHSQFADLIGARGPNTQINCACASTTQAVGLAEDWIRAGRCRRVVVIAGDDVTSDELLGWFGSGFLATGAAATDDDVAEAAIPFDRRRHGMILGMGAAALVVERADAARERGLQPICEVLGTATANSAFHGTRLDVDHIGDVMERLVAGAEARTGIDRHAIAPATVFVSHETYTPARGGSASAEIFALRRVFGADADRLVIANTKGFTGHPMAVGLEDVVAVKALETGIVPPVANFREPDPELGPLNLSKGGSYPIDYALRLAAGFGSQISMLLLHRIPAADGRRRGPDELGYAYRVSDPAQFAGWLTRVSGDSAADLEVVKRRLRLVDHGPAAIAPATPPAIAPVAQVATTAPPLADPVAPALPAPTEPVAVAPEPAAAVVVDAVAVDAVSVDAVVARVVAMVAEQTGYPAAMLAMDLDLEADLGIDTVKQAELFAQVREEYGIERDDKLKLRDYPTLNHVVGFVRDRSPHTPTPETPATAPTVAPEPAAAVVVEPVAVDAVAVDAVSVDAVVARVVAMVAEQTGYPAEMLAMDLDLEADLGIDTVKQAELFAQVREEYGIERDDKLKLRDYPTLNHVVGFVRDRSPHTPTPETPATETPATAPAEPAAAVVVEPAAVPVDAVSVDAVVARVVAMVAEQTGYPAEMLAMDLDLEADLGIDTVKQAELFAQVREEYGIERDDKLKLRDYPTLNHVVGFVRDRSPHTPTPETPATAPTVAPEPAAAVVVEPVAVDAVAVDAVSVDAVVARVVAMVAEQTGYPAEMLAMDLDLEADLGIDTVKQAELFAQVREEYGIERDDKLKLRDYPTLNHVVGFVRDRSPHTPTPETPATAPESADAGTDTGTDTGTVAPDAQDEAFPRRVPVVVPRPELGHCMSTGVTLGAGCRVFVLADTGGVAAALVDGLHQLGVETLVVDDAPHADELVALLTSWRNSGPITGVYWLPALDDEGSHAALDPATWSEGIRIRVKLLAAAMRELYGDIAPPGTFLVSATRLGGLHGYGPTGASAPMGGAVTGFTKAYARERADALVKAVDFGTTDDATVIAECLLAETLHDPGAVEIGHHDGQRWSIALASQPAEDGGPERSLTPESVFVITGAAGSIVSAITADLAVSGGTFHLLDLVPEPDPADPDLERYVTDRDGLKRELAERIAASGERATPARVERELARLERAKAAADTIEAVHRAGGSAHWHQVDLTDGDAVDAVMREVQSNHARVDVLLHAAGLEISHTLDNKPTREYDLVFDVKCNGWFNLLHGLGDLALGTAVVFSSIAGRFGNGGQTDYSAANDLLCKSISSFRTARPASRGVAIDWTAWASIGMASRGSIPKMMEFAGIDMLPPEVGVPVVRREITAAGNGGEVVVGGSLGMLLAESDGVDLVVARSSLDATAGPMLGAFAGWTMADGLAVRTTLDPVEQGFLDHHRIDGTPVLPGVMGIEGFAEVASASAAGWTTVAIDDVAFLAPCKFYRDEPRDLELVARPCLAGDDVVVECRLLARRTLANQTEQLTTHFTGRVRLARDAAPPRTVDPVGEPSDRAVGADDIYRIYFHGPAYQVVDSAWRDGERVVGRLADDLPPDHRPDDAPLLVEPRLIELCFQTAGILELGTTGLLALPLRVGRLLLFPVPDPVGRWLAVVTPRVDGRGVDAVVVDELGHVRIALEAYETIALPMVVEDGALEPLGQAM